MSEGGAETEAPLVIVAGGGTLPFSVADAAIRRGRRIVLIGLRGWADETAMQRYPHRWIAVGQAGRLLRYARAAGARDLVLVGSLVRPPILSLRIDWTLLRLLPRLYRIYRGGDDHLLSGVAKLFEERGFRIVGAHEVAPEILIAPGRLGARAPSSRDLTDVARGLDLLRSIAAFDVGQAVVVADNQVLAIEAADGTDNMLAHIASLRERSRIPTRKGVGVLVKAPKVGQDHRLDMPAIGPATVEAVARAGLAGIAVLAGSTIIAEPLEVARAADAAQVFVYGIESPK